MGALCYFIGKFCKFLIEQVVVYWNTWLQRKIVYCLWALRDVAVALYCISRYALNFVKSKVCVRMIEAQPKTALEELAEKVIITPAERRTLIAGYLEMGKKLPKMLRYQRTRSAVSEKRYSALIPLDNDLTLLHHFNYKMFYCVPGTPLNGFTEIQLEYDLATANPPMPTACPLSCV